MRPAKFPTHLRHSGTGGFNPSSPWGACLKQIIYGMFAKNIDHWLFLCLFHHLGSLWEKWKKMVICPILILCSSSLDIIVPANNSTKGHKWQVTKSHREISSNSTTQLSRKVTVQVLKYRGRNAAAKSKLPRPRADHCAILSLQLKGPCSCLNSERNGLKRLLQKWEAGQSPVSCAKTNSLGNTMVILYLNDWEAEKSANPTIIRHDYQELKKQVMNVNKGEDNKFSFWKWPTEFVICDSQVNLVFSESFGRLPCFRKFIRSRLQLFCSLRK